MCDNNEKIIDAAVNWWTNAVSKRQQQDAGIDSPNMAIAMIMLQSMYKPIDDSQKEVFRQTLKESITELHMINLLSVDYGPSVLLSEAAEKANIPMTNFPVKTSMQIRGDGKLLVKVGYGSPYEEIMIEN